MSDSVKVNSMKIAAVLVPFSMAINLFNYYWLDIIVVLTTIFAFLLAQKNRHELAATFGLKNNVYLCFVAIYLLGNFLGYVTTTPMSSQEWNEIFSFRWVWGFFAFYALGHIASESRQKVQWYFLSFGFVLALILIKQYQWTSGSLIDSANRLVGFYTNPNYLALALSLALAFILPFAFYRKFSPAQFGLYLTLVLGAICLLSTYSRTSWFGAACAVLVAILYTRSKRLIGTAAIVSVVSLLAIYVDAFHIKSRLLESFDYSTYNSQTARWIVMKSAWQMFLDHPIFGVGFEHSSRLHPEYFIKIGHPNVYVVRHAHNQILDVLSGSGIVGLIGYLGFFISGYTFFHRKFKTDLEIHRKQIALGAILCIVTLFACSWTDAPFRLHEARNFILITLGFSYGYLNVSQIKKTDVT